jgi:hypothetical protein
MRATIPSLLPSRQVSSFKRSQVSGKRGFRPRAGLLVTCIYFGRGGNHTNPTRERGESAGDPRLRVLMLRICCTPPWNGPALGAGLCLTTPSKCLTARSPSFGVSLASKNTSETWVCDQRRRPVGRASRRGRETRAERHAVAASSPRRCLHIRDSRRRALVVSIAPRESPIRPVARADGKRRRRFRRLDRTRA